jgi:uncharacterized membrane protein YqgA involved in biofilm formation
MSGTLVNMLAIILGSTIGLVIGNRLPRKIQESVVTGLGFVTLTIGVQSAMGSGNIILPLLSIGMGVIIGELLNIDGALKRFGGWLQDRVAQMGAQDQADLSADEAAQARVHARIRFINGFVTSSLVFCIGPMAVLGSIQNGINALDMKLLAIKSTLDFFASIAFAASLGLGVMFSIIPTLVLQGGFALVGMALVSSAAGLTAQTPFIRELSATGGLILIGLALILLDLKQPRIANFLPALVVAPLLVLLAGLIGVQIYPVLN